jgi:hypothetical protein
MEGVIAIAKQKIETLEFEDKTIKKQLKAMKNVGGISLWPKPILYLIFQVNFDSTTYIPIKSCVFCAQGYHCYDVITFCKHTFHSFCFYKLLRDNNSCFVCGQTLHPNWWRSFGFHVEDDDIETLVEDMGLESQWEAMKQSMVEMT